MWWFGGAGADTLLRNHRPGEEAAMLAEKFFLVLETLKSHASDGSVRVVSTTPRVPVRLPTKTTDKQVANN
ncbi:hypothetical protein CWO89_20050 [Bradyrhizobium sp. Leo170]|nr:hypothetical protein CWO89_20050 [Bradyrhizobium sp. Leo170]